MKPFNGGNAEIAIAPNKNESAVNGMVFINPPRSSILRIPVVALYTLPAQRKSKLLKIAWLMRWYNPAVIESTAKMGWLIEMNTIAAPIPSRIIPMFSTLQYANNFFRSCSIKAYITPAIQEIEAITSTTCPHHAELIPRI